MRSGSLFPFLIFCLLLASGCGVKQYNALSAPARAVAAHGPFFASGIGGDNLAPAACGSVSGRPCIRARASFGTPFQHDINTNSSKGIIAAGNSFPVPGPYTSTAGAGKASSPSISSENRDLYILERQATLH